MPTRIAGLTRAKPAAHPRRAVAWTILVASCLSVGVVGLLATVGILARVGAWSVDVPPTFWGRLLGACALTLGGLALRSLRWIFLLRRAGIRIPIRDAYIGYLAGFSLLLAPLLIGEIAVRAAVHRSRGGVPVLTTAVVNVWERLLDFLAIGLVLVLGSLIIGRGVAWHLLLVCAPAALMFAPVRRLTFRVVVGSLMPLTQFVERLPAPDSHRLLEWRAWSVGLAVSVVAWLLPGLGLWLLAGTWGTPIAPVEAGVTFAAAALASAVQLVPGGVVIAGREMLTVLAEYDVAAARAVLIVAAVRLATAGLCTALGVVYLQIHRRTAARDRARHFDDIADVYDVQIPESRRQALLGRKIDLLTEYLEPADGLTGLDIGCGQGWYLAALRTRGFDVQGIDTSAGQVRRAAELLGRDDLVSVGSVLEIPAADETFDFVYVINVLHHLGSVDEQRRAFDELFRVLKPGGRLFVHEINTRNPLFSFYMGYVFPSMNCIDEGVEHWLLPHRLEAYTDEAVVDVRYFTFLPDFAPRFVVRFLSPMERRLEASSLRVYSAHYLAVFRKGPGG